MTWYNLVIPDGIVNVLFNILSKNQYRDMHTKEIKDISSHKKLRKVK